MLKGGTVQIYLRGIADDPRSSVLLVGKQLPGTPGAQLLNHGVITLGDYHGDSTTHRVKAKVAAFDFSCHVGQREVLNYLKHARGNPTIFTMHGEPASCEALAQMSRERFGYTAQAATCGQTITFN